MRLNRAPPAAHLVALVAEGEPVHGLDLEHALRDLGCAVLGPAGAGEEALALLGRRRPDLALLGARLIDGAAPRVAEALAVAGVLFAVVATGSEGDGLDTHPVLRGAPRLLKPYHAPELRRAVRGLRRASLEARLASAARRVTLGQERLARQRALVGRLASAGGDVALAEGAAREIARTLALLRARREGLRRALEAEVGGSHPPR